jgi:hypothetical protein
MCDVTVTESWDEPLHGGWPITFTNNIATFAINSKEIQHACSTMVYKIL